MNPLVIWDIKEICGKCPSQFPRTQGNTFKLHFASLTNPTIFKTIFYVTEKQEILILIQLQHLILRHFCVKIKKLKNKNQQLSTVADQFSII